MTRPEATLQFSIAGFRSSVQRLLRDESGATSIEYGLIASLMAVAIIASLKQLGNNTTGSWGSTANKVGNAMQ
jgi:pilus assembly protein Flp/PilA